MNNMNEVTSKEITVLAEGHFNRGYDIFRDGLLIDRVPQCTYWSDDFIRLINRDGIAVFQEQEVDYCGTKAYPTGRWNDLYSIGPAKDLQIVEDEI